MARHVYNLLVGVSHLHFAAAQAARRTRALREGFLAPKHVRKMATALSQFRRLPLGEPWS